MNAVHALSYLIFTSLEIETIIIPTLQVKETENREVARFMINQWPTEFVANRICGQQIFTQSLRY